MNANDVTAKQDQDVSVWVGEQCNAGLLLSFVYQELYCMYKRILGILLPWSFHLFWSPITDLF